MAVSGVGANRQRNAQIAAQEAEQDARDRIESAQRRVREADRKSEDEIDRLRKEFAHRRDAYVAKAEDSLLSEQERAYQQLLETKRRQQSDITRIQRQGEASVDQARAYYENAAADVESKGKTKLYDQEKKAQTQLESQQRRSKGEIETQHRRHEMNLKNLQATHHSRMQMLDQAYNHDHETQRQRHFEAREKAEKSLSENFQHLQKHHTEVLNHLNHRAAEQIEDTRADTSRKLDAYSARQNDPFYKMVDVGAQLSESDQAYVVRTPVPPQERDNVSVVIRGDQIVVSGYRRNEEKLELEPGRVKSSAAYQTYSESFPITWPVKADEMTKQYQGNELVVTIPKKLVPRQVTAAKGKSLSAEEAQAQIQADKPHFPPNLVLEEEASAKEKGPSRKTRPLGWDA